MINEIYETCKKYARTAIAAGVLSLPLFCSPSCALDYGSKPKARNVQLAQHTSQARSIETIVN
ncbi:MAG: hypothetical protein ABH840_00580 [Nanoarchaeota archaeon]